MMKIQNELPSGLKQPLGQVSAMCKGRQKSDFNECQRVLSRHCLPFYNAAKANGDTFANCLSENISELPMKSEGENEREYQ